MGIRNIPAIDGLRAIAVLAVVAYHAGAPAGFVGVDVFFVISGYLITRLLMEDGRLVEFYARRARRILPAAFLCVAVTLGLSFLLLPGAGDVARSAAASGLFVANLFFQSATGDYWSADAASMPLLHLWSLSVEEQFYLAWPVVLIFARKRPAILWWVFGMSFALYAWLSYADPNAAFYQTPARAWELTAGALVATGMSRIRDIRIGLPLVLLACLVPLPVPVAVVLSVFGTAMVLAYLHHGGTVRWLASRPMVAVGLISYSLYLWHWPLLAIDRATRIGESHIGTRLALVAIAFVLAGLTYRYVETPFRRMRFRPGRTVFAGVACAALVAATGLTMAAKSPPKPVVVAKPLTCEGVPQKPSCYTTEPKVVVWGDSFATAWMPYVEHVANGLPVVLFFNTGCYPTAGEAVWRRSARETASCKAHNDKALAYLQRNGAEVLVLTSYYAELFREHPNHPGVANLVRALPNVKRIVVIGPTPEIPAPSHDVTKGEFLAKSRGARDALSSLPVEVVDPTDYFCGEVCSFRRDGMELYSDRVHVTIAAVRGYVSQGEKPEGTE